MTPRDGRAPAGIASPGSGGYIPEVESLRGIAIALVFLSHANAWVLWRTPADGELVSPLAAFMAAGHTGVSLFFVLSGFLLSRPFLKESAGRARVDRGGYLARRALRILPLYVVTVAFAMLITARHSADVWRGVPYLFFLQGLPGCTVPLDPYPNGPWWSLSTEVQFYLLLLALPLLLRRRRLAIAVMVTYVLAYAAFAANVWHPSSVDAHVKLSHSAFGRGPAFVLGVVAAWLDSAYGSRVRARATANRLARLGGADVALAFVLVALAYLLRHVAAIGYARAELEQHGWHVAEALLWTTVLLLLLAVPLRSKSLFVNGAWEKLGLISYSVYLAHAPVLLYGLTALRGRFEIHGWTGRSIMGVVVLAVACIGVSSLTYLVIERPFLRRKARFGWWARPHAPARPALAEAEASRTG